ncbi:DUF4209 domain-containing protein [uncultured Alistipes sp.]|jgi:hypothetical protein|uniref:DUF4209 domain-containing protein n=1 Tax=uncultured Alistipes sp. TaxID=538949 RepID=UPI0025D4E6C6|nr:DUF4209 domain-containing protein [uncultured Alistipes sp.]
MTLQDFYKDLDDYYTIQRHFINRIELPSMNELTPEEIEFVSYENIALTFHLNDSIRERLEGQQDAVSSYFLGRIKDVSNFHLLAKYNHFLLWFTKNGTYAQPVIDYYLDTIDFYAEKDYDDKGLYFLDLLNIVLSIAAKYKLSTEVVKAKISKLINADFLTSHDKVFVVEAINNEEDNSWNIKKRKSIYTSEESKAFAVLCISSADNEDCSERDRERYLLQGLEFAKKSNDNELIKEVYNLLADSEYRYIKPIDKENPAIAHQNEGHYLKVIEYYKLSGNKEKERVTLLELEENNKHLWFPKIKIEEPIPNPDRFNEVWHRHLNSMLDCTSNVLVNRLCFCHKELFLPTHDALNKSVAANSRNSMFSLFTIRTLDINRNSREVSAEENTTHFIFNMWLDNFGMRFLQGYIKRAIRRRKLKYSTLKKQLLKTSFGWELYAVRGDKQIAYNWFSLVDEGFKDFFKQAKRGIKSKSFNMQLAIETLTLKFEAILRDIVSLLDGVITKVYNGDTSLITLEQLLDSEVLRKVFNDDDIMLFRQVFTKRGYNIRNNVAHGFYKKEDYGIGNAILVFICVLRLNKFTFYNPSVS